MPPSWLARQQSYQKGIFSSFFAQQRGKSLLEKAQTDLCCSNSPWHTGRAGSYLSPPLAWGCSCCCWAAHILPIISVSSRCLWKSNLHRCGCHCWPHDCFVSAAQDRAVRKKLDVGSPAYPKFRGSQPGLSSWYVSEEQTAGGTPPVSLSAPFLPSKGQRAHHRRTRNVQ